MYYEKHPDRLAVKCAKEFPPVEATTTTDSTGAVLPGVATVTNDTAQPVKTAPVAFNCDSAIAAAKASGNPTNIFAVGCPPCPPSIHTTVYKTDTVTKYKTVETTKIDRAAVKVEQDKAVVLQSQNIKQGEKLFFYKRSASILLIILIVWFLLRCLRTWLSKFTAFGWLAKLL